MALTRIAGGAALIGALCLPGCFRAPAYSPGSFARSWAPAPASARVDRDQAAARAVERSPDVAAARAAARASELGVGAAEQMVNPELRINQLRLDQIVDDRTALELGVRFRPERPGAIDARVHEATMAVEEAMAGVDAVEQRVASEARILVDRVSGAERELAAMELELQARDAVRAEIAARVAAAAATRTALAEADLDLAVARDDREALRLELARAQADLTRVVGAPVATAPSPDQVVTLPPDEALVRRALETRPGLRAQAARIAAAEGDAWVERSRAWPWLSFVEVDYDIDPSPDPLAFGVAVGVELPLLSWNGGGVKQADARVASLRTEQEATARGVADVVTADAARVRATAERVRVVRDELFPSIDAAARIIEEAVAAGAEDPLAALRAHLERARAERRLARAMQQHREAVGALEATLGGPLTP